ncbi:MAG: hypothetical protein PUD87_08030 [Prevotellaceae bacterium]|nr:hypothetical protein [Prevotellaceae bacterium]
MKKKILILLTGLVLGLSSVWAKAVGGCVILQHAGNETYFEAQDAQAAMDAAVEGDTLVFAEAESGSYPAITMNKKVYIISSGYLCIDLEIPGNPSLDECLFQTYQHWIEIFVKSDLQRLYLNDTFVYVHANTENVTVGSLEMDRCLCWGIWYNSGLKKIVANNCLFENNFYLVGETQGLQSATFTNCRFTMSEIPVVNGTFKNSIFNYYSDTPYTMNACTFTNCLMDKDYWVLGEGSTKASCYNLNRETFSNDKDYLTSNNYLGSDGTVVGEWGGTNPFKDGRSYGAAANIWNLNKKGNKMSVRMEIYDR